MARRKDVRRPAREAGPPPSAKCEVPPRRRQAPRLRERSERPCLARRYDPPVTLSDAALRHLRQVADLPDLTGTRYELLAPLGRGGMGAVYRVHDRALARAVAMKVLNGAVGGDAAARLEQEARVLARLEHPGIVPVHDVGTLADGRLFYVMKLVEGERLDALAARVESIPERLRVLVRVADTVAFAHAHGIIHRDLSPANIMIGPFGEVLVLDWGMALLEHGPVAPVQSHAAVGTPGFMAPEQARGTAGPASDVYALGALLAWWLATERGGPRRMPRPLASITAKAMAPNPSDRYPSVEALAADLARYLDARPVAAHRESPSERVLRFTRRYRVAILLVVGYLLMRVALLVLRGL
jgi:eukaryotic-like serine/threonine-protein kinase